MKQGADKLMPELPGLSVKRGRPVTGTALTTAQRVRAYRQRNSLAKLTVDIPCDLLDQLNDYLRLKDKTKSDVLISLLKNQLLRKR